MSGIQIDHKLHLHTYFKIGSHDTIYIFKNYFTIISLIFNNKRYLDPKLHLHAQALLICEEIL